MNVVLVNPPQPGLVDPYTYPPVGLAYVQAAVKQARPDLKCRILNLAGASVQSAANAIEEQAPSVVGYTATTTYWREVCQLAWLIRARDATVKQVVGGPHPTLTGQSAECFDAVFVGPGEGAFVQFLGDLDDAKHRRIYSPIEVNINHRAHPEPEEVLGGRLHAASRERAAVVFSSYGCTNNCAFCAARGMYRRIEIRSAENVEAELRAIRERGIEDVRFMDDTFGIDPERVEVLCDRIAALGMRWGCVIRVDQVTSHLLGAMRRAGCVEVGFGAESFDQAVLDAIGKQATVAENINAVDMARDAGLDVHLFLMISTPGETAQSTVDLNVAALEKLRHKFTRLLLSTLMPYPGSPIHRCPHKFGALLLESDATKYNQHQYQGRDAQEAPVWSPLLFEGMTRQEQLDNIRAMRDYAAGLRQVNRGRFGGVA